MDYVVSKDGTKIAYDTFGQGVPLVVVYGATCFRNFFPIKSDTKAFAKEFKVFSYDRRGRGDSADSQAYSVQREVEDIAAVADAAQGKVVLYGHSSGAALALEAAWRFPEKILRVVIYDASYCHDEAEKKSYAELIRKVSHLVGKKKDAESLKTFLREIGMPSAFVFLMPLIPGWKTMKALYHTLLYDMEITKDLPPIERFSGIKVPVSVVYGEKNPASIPAVAKILADAIPGSRLQEIKGADHMISTQKLMPILRS